MKCLGTALLLAFISLSNPFRTFGQTVQVTDQEVRVTVSDKNGEFVGNLKSADFAVFDNGIRQKVADFDQKVHSPLQLAVLIDRSSSVGERFSLVQQAAETFIKSVIHESGDEGMVVAFDSKVYLLQDWTADSSLLINSIDQLSVAGGTSLFDAIYKTCRDKFAATDPRQRVVVLVTDGEDTSSNATFEQSLAMAKLSDVAVYVVGIRAEDSLNTRELQGHKVLKDLANLTGGRVFYPNSFRPDEEAYAQLAGLFQSVQTEMRNAYSLVYDVEGQPDNSFHNIRVETRDKSLTVHAPTGYFFRKPMALP